MLLVILCVHAILASNLCVMARPSDKNFIWTVDNYEFILDTPVVEKLVSPPYFKEWTVRELISIPAKRNLILDKYPGFPVTRPSTAVVSDFTNDNAAISPSPSLM